MNASLVSDIRSRCQKVMDQVAAAAKRSNRDLNEIRLVVVSKSQPLEVVKAAISAGVTVLGENYAEEAVGKMAALDNSAVEWHMIGHVQGRKAGLVAGHFSLLHSLDSFKLAVRLDRFCGELNRRMPVLLEVNVSGEESKFGFPAWEEKSWPSLADSFAQLMDLRNLQLCGLMTMPPYSIEPEQTRPYFQRLLRLRNQLASRLPQVDWKELSMGTSADFVPAVEEGATLIRVGQAILGPRPE